MLAGKYGKRAFRGDRIHPPSTSESLIVERRERESESCIPNGGGHGHDACVLMERVQIIVNAQHQTSCVEHMYLRRARNRVAFSVESVASPLGTERESESETKQQGVHEGPRASEWDESTANLHLYDGIIICGR